MMEDSIMEVEGDMKKVKTARMTIQRRIDNGHNIPTPDSFIKRIILSITKPSYTLQRLPIRSLRFENRCRLRRLLHRLVRRHNWKEASGVLSMLLKGTGKDKSPARNRKYMVAMKLLKHIKSDNLKATKIQSVYDVWLKKIGWMKNWPLEHRFMVRLEFILYCLTQGNAEDAHQAVMCLMQECDSGNDPMSNMVVGLTFFQMWYSSIPKEMQWGKLDEPYASSQSETLGTRSNTPVESFEEHDTVDIYEADSSIKKVDVHDAESSSSRDSKTSVRNEADIALDQSFQPQSFYVNSAKDSGHDNSSSSNHGDDMAYASIFHLRGLDSWLLPLRLPHTNENLEDFNHLHKEMLNDYYKNAVKYLRLALFATAPLFEALVPLIQILLLGHQVQNALKVLEKVCHNCDTALPLRLKASILEQFDRNNHVVLSTCFEDIMKKDPTCSHSLAKLINIHKSGYYGLEQLLEMVALHLDATYADCNTWKEFACCFLKLSQCEEERMSVCLDGTQGGHKQRYSVHFNRMPQIFTDGILGKPWRFRCRWWLTRHFSQNILESELAAGNLELLTYKAACASHLYGQDFTYVAKVHSYLEDKNGELLRYLLRHMQDSVGIYKNFDRNN
ncbi:uncharacterized protein LOC132307663 [Cornus florida]|uniref:uncharacterized protein LOC132307663 n=1 Tax=Cornus florida TaxID=4283 RepID=UPI00289BC728|nr:uncharacterized protein LOC132307663 [Cornus florida]